MATKHTRGPWQCSTSANGLLVSKTSGEVVAQFKVAPTKDDAALIAAATEMLEALQLAEATIERLAPNGSRATQGTRDVISAVILKATRR